MRKHSQVLWPKYQALLLLRPGQGFLLLPWVLRIERAGHREDSPGLQLSSWPGASCPWPWGPQSPKAGDRKAKLRLLAPALRQALRATVQPPQYPQAPQRRHERLPQMPAAALTQSWALAQLLCVCLSPADAAQLRIHWVVV